MGNPPLGMGVGEGVGQLLKMVKSVVISVKKRGSLEEEGVEEADQEVIESWAKEAG